MRLECFKSLLYLPGLHDLCLFRLYKVYWLGANRQGWWKWDLLGRPFRLGEHIQGPMGMFSFIPQCAFHLFVCFMKASIGVLNPQPDELAFLAEVCTRYFPVRAVEWKLWSWKMGRGDLGTDKPSPGIWTPQQGLCILHSALQCGSFGERRAGTHKFSKPWGLRCCRKTVEYKALEMHLRHAWLWAYK